MRTFAFIILACLVALEAPAVAIATPATRAPTTADLIARVQAEGRLKSYAHAESIVLAAQAHATVDFPVDLLLGLADTESDFHPASVSRLLGATQDPATRRWVGGYRKTGVWTSKTAPAGAVGNYFCGITQVTASSWKRCLALRDVDLAMQTGVAELTGWLKRAKTVERALQGHGCGNSGMKGACRRYARKVLSRARVFSMPVVIHRPSV